MSNKILDNLLNYDAIGDAESLYGKLGDDNKEGFAYAMDMIQSRSALLKREMVSRGDVYDRMNPEDYLKVVHNAGFQTVAEEVFKDREGRDNKLVVLWHPDGMLLKLDTYTWHDGERTINSANLYYNIKITSKTQDRFTKKSSGHMHWTGPITPDDKNATDIWVGSHDAREALLYKIEGLRSIGVFQKEWVESDHVYLTHYMDVPESEKDWRIRSDMLQDVICKRFATLPKELGDMLLKVYRRD